MLAILDAVVLGIIEGLTEFLPISSTGHLIVAGRVLDFKDSHDIFTVVIQVGAIAAVIWFFRQDLTRRVLGLLRGDKQAVQFWKLLLIASIPAGLLGLALDAYIEKITVPVVVAIALIAGGIVLWLVDRRPVPRHDVEPKIDSIKGRQAWLVGFGQCLALVPGVSRSGATIISGLAAGMDRPTATAFSFYLSIPVLAAASGYKLIAHGDSLDNISGGVAAILVGMGLAFITALAAISWLLHFVSRHNFKSFAYYRIILGVGILIFLGVS
ncbi:MAG: undecaprenyl-diphosphate phosphatase [Patescibacteria group bacterium]